MGIGREGRGVIDMTAYLAAVEERVRAGRATKEEQETVMEALRAKIAERNLAYIRALNVGQSDAIDSQGR